MRWAIVAVALAFTLVGTPGRTSAQPEPGVTVDLAFTHVYAIKDTDVVRFVAYIRNPHPYTVAGVTTRWEGYAADGTVVGTFSKTHPPILGGTSWTYVGGAGSANLTGRPASVAVFLEHPGQQTDALARTFPVEGVVVERAGGGDSQPDLYLATGTATTDGAPLDRVNTRAIAVARGADGQIVGADFSVGLTVYARPVLPPGAVLNLGTAIYTVAPATSAEMLAYADLP
jgi:hypothetical protein